ncbi:MAG: divalent metal cation transporter FieF [Alphaproteobacteria bacterium RIFOXYD12_FULL_60_8]|nr:MAG: divalent metal cation transporter FieF [Alphaproteobacteria bacterium RIFOXYD12_FULL_60_8]
MRMATYASVGVAGVLIAVKLVAWVMTDSMALLSSLVDSFLDAAASLINLFAVRQALQPADRHHRFGHGKAEPLAGLGQAAFISGSALFLSIEAVNRLFSPEPVQRGEVGIGVMIFSILVTIALVQFQRRVAHKTKSVAIRADSLHYAGDVLINLSVIVSLLLGMFFDLPIADPAFAAGIALYLLYNAWGILVDSLSLLMDQEFPEEDRQKIRDIALGVKGARNIHDLRTRSSGPTGFIQLHLEMDRNITLWEAHAIADRAEAKIRKAFPNTEVIIHQDPEGVFEHHPEHAYADRAEDSA